MLVELLLSTFVTTPKVRHFVALFHEISRMAEWGEFPTIDQLGRPGAASKLIKKRQICCSNVRAGFLVRNNGREILRVPRNQGALAVSAVSLRRNFRNVPMSAQSHLANEVGNNDFVVFSCGTHDAYSFLCL